MSDLFSSEHETDADWQWFSECTHAKGQWVKSVL